MGSRVAVVTAVMEPTPPDKECLMFWYYMEGNEVGELSVYLQTAENQRHSAPLWTRSGDQGKHWRHGRVTLSSDTPYQVNWLSDNCRWILTEQCIILKSIITSVFFSFHNIVWFVHNFNFNLMTVYAMYPLLWKVQYKYFLYISP